MERDSVDKPERVKTAVKLLYISLGIGVLRGVIEIPMYAQKTSPIFTIFVVLFVFGIMYVFIYMIGKGHNWARIIFLVMFFIGLPFSLFPILQSFAVNPISGLLGIGQIAIQAIALVFLFQKPSSQWFKKMKLKKNE